jgi:hypothetical protein
MEQLTRIIRSLRGEHHFRGYIHLKSIPDADPEQIRQAGPFADRLSINIENADKGVADAVLEQRDRLLHARPDHTGCSVGGLRKGMVAARCCAATFNPAQLNLRLMQSRLPPHFWRNQPEVKLIAGVVHEADAQTERTIRSR